jgi:hypothetical protein
MAMIGHPLGIDYKNEHKGFEFSRANGEIDSEIADPV